MPFLGTTYRLAYEAKNLATGLTNIVAMVYRPDGAVVGPIPLVEIGGAFAGIYAANYISDVLDPEGEYLVAYVSPTDMIRAPARFTMEVRPTGTTLFVRLQPSPPSVIGTVLDPASVVGQVAPDSVVGVISPDGVEAEISNSQAVGLVSNDGVQGRVAPSNVTGHTSDEGVDLV